MKWSIIEINANNKFKIGKKTQNLISITHLNIILIKIILIKIRDDIFIVIFI
jgi:hypothetical protein